MRERDKVTSRNLRRDKRIRGRLYALLPCLPGLNFGECNDEVARLLSLFLACFCL